MDEPSFLPDWLRADVEDVMIRAELAPDRIALWSERAHQAWLDDGCPDVITFTVR